MPAQLTEILHVPLTPALRRDIEQQAQAEAQTMASIGRRALIIGLAVLKQQALQNEVRHG